MFPLSIATDKKNVVAIAFAALAVVLFALDKDIPGTSLVSIAGTLVSVREKKNERT